MRARPLANMGAGMSAALAVALACAAPAVAQPAPPASGAHLSPAHKPSPKVSAKKSAHKAAPVKAAIAPPAKPVVKKPGAPRPKPRRAAKPAPKAAAGVLAFAGCYGRFIGWRDELSSLMLQSNSYTPWPLDRARFDRIENAFAASAQRDRHLALILQPSFKEADFPADVRAAFRAGLKTAASRFAEAGYRHSQLDVLGAVDLTPVQRMSQLEMNADQAFAPLSASCERLAAP